MTNDWIQHNDPRGFSLQHPRGWVVQADESTRRILVGAPERGVFVLTQPFVGDTVAWLRSVPQALADVFPNARMGRADASPGKPHEMFGSLEFGMTASGVCRANIMCNGNGQGGMVYAMAAPVNIFDRMGDIFSQVLGSLRFGQPQTNPQAGPQTAPQSPGQTPDFTRWVDPNENAFICEVPTGWRVDGGMFRASMTDVRSELRVSAPDGRVYVQYGDRNIPPFALPSMMGMSLGMVEGTWYSPAPGTNMFIKRYAPGAYFAQEYAQQTLSRTFGQVSVQHSQELPVQLNGQQQGMPGRQAHRGVAQVTAGHMRGTVTAATSVSQLGDGGLWYVTELEVILAQPGSEALAQNVQSRVKGSFQVNPQWQAQQQGMTSQASVMSQDFFRSQAQAQRQITETLQATSDLQQQSFNDRWNADSERQRHFGNMITGQTDVMDANTGETWRVQSGNQHYWRANNQDVIVGTDQPDDLGPQDFTRLKEY
jgi:hypothetical protein